MNKIDFLKQLRFFVEEGNIEEALNWFGRDNAEFTISFSNDLVMLKSQLNSAKNQFILKGIIEKEEYNRIIARISCAILELADKLEKKIGRPNQTRYGQVLHRIPSKMTTLGETKCIIRIAYDVETLIKKIIVDSETKFERIQITEIMCVELIDSNEVEIFKIRTCTDEEQFVIYDDFTQWIFFVKPLRQGCYPLQLKIDVIEMINGIERKRNIVFEKEIIIETHDINKGEDQFQVAYIQLEDIKLITKELPTGREDVNKLREEIKKKLREGKKVTASQSGLSEEAFDSKNEMIIAPGKLGGQFACFLKGTKIMVNYDEHKSIESLKVGDEVLTKSSITNKISIEKIKNILITVSNDYIIINNSLKVTMTELIVTKMGSIAALDLKLSDHIELFDFGFIQIISIKIIKKNVKVYNLEFEEPCLFFANRILVGDLHLKNTK